MNTLNKRLWTVLLTLWLSANVSAETNEVQGIVDGCIKQWTPDISCFAESDDKRNFTAKSDDKISFTAKSDDKISFTAKSDDKISFTAESDDKRSFTAESDDKRSFTAE
jgi:hypothetical protein